MHKRDEPGMEHRVFLAQQMGRMGSLVPVQNPRLGADGWSLRPATHV